MLGYWDQRVRGRVPAGWRDMLLHAARYAPDEGNEGNEGNEGGGGGGGNGNNGNGGNNNPPPWAGEFGDNFDAERAWRTISALRESERTLKTQNRTLDGKVKKFEEADQSETERLTNRIAELETENQRLTRAETARVRQAQIADVARQQGAHYPDEVYRLLDEGTFEMDGDRIKNAAKLVGDLKTARPLLFGNTSQDSQRGRGQQDAGANDMNSMIRRAAGRGA